MTPSAIMFVHSSLDEAGLDPFEFRLFGRICRRWSKERGCDEAVPKMAEACGMNVKTAQLALATLERRRLIRRTPRKGTTDRFDPQPVEVWIPDPHPELRKAKPNRKQQHGQGTPKLGGTTTPEIGGTPDQGTPKLGGGVPPNQVGGVPPNLGDKGNPIKVIPEVQEQTEEEDTTFSAGERAADTPPPPPPPPRFSDLVGVTPPVADPDHQADIRRAAERWRDYRRRTGARFTTPAEAVVHLFEFMLARQTRGEEFSILVELAGDYPFAWIEAAVADMSGTPNASARRLRKWLRNWQRDVSAAAAVPRSSHTGREAAASFLPAHPTPKADAAPPGVRRFERKPAGTLTRPEVEMDVDDLGMDWSDYEEIFTHDEGTRWLLRPEALPKKRRLQQAFAKAMMSAATHHQVATAVGA